ncbi:hypothetical protein F7725_011647 [Dissostichus mawsoni]|uniref:Uncharacterized protein n=1 Tax=Dissostichus mawsoni TaxID=36200 RepID=A0A7J5Z9U5_DISMA|nr:hypothetical protein F7725_011647 [Dissostichus mawsoni]
MYEASVYNQESKALRSLYPKKRKQNYRESFLLCRFLGPHVVLLLISLQDLTEPERRANERRMEILTSAEWRHTKVLFTCKEWLRERGRSVEENIPSGGPTVLRLMGKLFDNNTADSSKREGSRRPRGMEPEGAEAESSTGGRDGCGKREETTKGSQDEDKHGATAGAQVRDGREEQEGSLGKEQENKEECAGRKMNRGEDEEERAKVRFERLSSEEDG